MSTPEMCGPWEIGAYYEPTSKLPSARIEQRHIDIPFDVLVGEPVLCVKVVRRVKPGLSIRGRYFKDEWSPFTAFARFAYFQFCGGEQFLATFDIEVGPQALDHTEYLKKVVSPLRLLAWASEGKVPCMPPAGGVTETETVE